MNKCPLCKGKKFSQSSSSASSFTWLFMVVWFFGRFLGNSASLIFFIHCYSCYVYLWSRHGNSKGPMLYIPAAKSHLYPKEVKGARIYTCVLLLLDKLPLNGLVLVPISKLGILKQSPKELHITVELLAAFIFFLKSRIAPVFLQNFNQGTLCRL